MSYVNLLLFCVVWEKIFLCHTAKKKQKRVKNREKGVFFYFSVGEVRRRHQTLISEAGC